MTIMDSASTFAVIIGSNVATVLSAIFVHLLIKKPNHVNSTHKISWTQRFIGCIKVH